VIDENTPQSYRHRLPQERRTPEVYGRAALLNSRQQQQQQTQQQPIGQPPPQPQQQPGQQQQVRPYEDVFNANTRPPLEIPTGADNFSEQQHRHFQQQQHFKQQQQQQFIPQLGYPPHMHAQQEQNRFYDPNLSQQMPNNSNNNNSRQFQQFQGHQQQQQQQQHQQQIHPEQLAAMRQARPASTVERVPRPHSADFLEYERQFGPQQDSGPGPVGVPHRGQNSHHRLPNRPQPPRPKSSIEQRIPSELRRQMIEQQNVEEGLIRLSTTTPTPRLNNNLSHNNKNNNNSFAYAQQQMQMLHLENNQIVDNVNVNNNNINVQNVQSVPRAPTTPRQPETSTPNYRNRPQKMNYNVRFNHFLFHNSIHNFVFTCSLFAHRFRNSVPCRNQIKTDKVTLA
jgi:hypothetical protein